LNEISDCCFTRKIPSAPHKLANSAQKGHKQLSRSEQ
jgi:hypothetical protein